MKKELQPHQQEAITVFHSSAKGIIHLPTGTGKSLIQSRYIVEDISKLFLQKSTSIPVYIVVAPKILLSNQLLNDIREDLEESRIDCQYLCVHSGSALKESDKAVIYREIDATTSSIEIVQEYKKAQREQVPLIISSTYDSLERINQANIPVKAILCDEAHNLVTNEFEKYTNDIIAEKIFFFTATLKDTKSDSGLGMNNKNRFGEILYQKSPAEMIQSGVIVRPRVHIVNITSSTTDEISLDVKAIIESFDEHKTLLNISPKILVLCKGQKHLNDIVNHPEFIKFRERKPNLTTFDITSDYGSRINNISLPKRDVWLGKLKDLTDRDEAIIFHVDILSEGIDIPGVTGVIYLDLPKLSKFLQNLGRATRLHPKDRERLYRKELKPSELDRLIKPYAWIIVPQHGDSGNDLVETLTTITYNLRDYDFNPIESVFIRPSNGNRKPVELGSLNELDTRKQRYKEIIANITHHIESEEQANQIINLSLKTESLDDIVLNLETVLNNNIISQIKYLESKGVSRLLDKIIRTPSKLIEEIINKIPEELFKNPNTTFFDPTCGSGLFLYLLKTKLLSYGHSEKHIVENMLFGCDISEKNTKFTEKILGLNKYKVNIMKGDSLKEEVFGGMRFDVVVGNPPYQALGEGRAEKLWPKFVDLAIKKVKEKGFVAMITPSSWMTGSSNIKKGSYGIYHNIFKLKNLLFVSSPSLEHFNDANTLTNYFVLQNTPKEVDPVFIIENEEVNVNLNEHNFLPPKFLTKTMLSINKKFLNYSVKLETLSFTGGDKERKRGKDFSDSVFKNKTYVRGGNRNNISYVYFDIVCNKKVAKERKIILPLSGAEKFTPFIDNVGIPFCTSCYVILLKETDTEKGAISFFYSKLVRFLIEQNRSSGFLPIYVIKNLPAIDMSKEWSNEELYDFFNLTKEEINLIENTVK